ncbi:endoplasmic reticulum Oxidoreductin 1-domain-containing protein [Xylariales sp. PMI_506]|nr:endoplasmic reticulum Oxidoreductin 1-domain-containing protein [Xylariales sp. PMI_506]
MFLKLPFLALLGVPAAIASIVSIPAPDSLQLQSSNGHSAQISPGAIVSDACVSYSTLEEVNRNIKPLIDDLTTNTDFFSYFRLNLFSKTCPFWNDENAMCGNIACAVSTIDDEKDIPEIWRASELSKVQGPKAEHPGKKIQREQPERPLQGSLGEDVGESCVVEYDDECDERDYCIPEDESAGSKGDYVSLVKNPERFTGYGGESAKMVWDAIYRENCFTRSSFPHSAALGSSSQPSGPAAQDLRSVLQDAGRQQMLEQQAGLATGMEFEEECLEKRVFYRVVSGMHASISTHLCADFLNQTTGEWQPNLECYISRLASHPERISNLYFNYALVTRAIAKIGPHLSGYTFCTGDQDQDIETKDKVADVVKAATSEASIFDESLMFKNGEGPSLKQEFKNRFRNITRIMDCTGCDKCRLWGKLQAMGYGTALKVLFEFDNDSVEIPVLKRTELVALFNLYARLSSSIAKGVMFREMIEDRSAVVDDEGAESSKVFPDPKVFPDRATKPHAVKPGQHEKAPETDPEDEWASPTSTPHSQQNAFKSSFDDEFGRFMLALKWVMKSYLELPGKAFRICIYELHRLFRSYIGLGAMPRLVHYGPPEVEQVFGGREEL